MNKDCLLNDLLGRLIYRISRISTRQFIWVYSQLTRFIARSYWFKHYFSWNSIGPKPRFKMRKIHFFSVLSIFLLADHGSTEAGKVKEIGLKLRTCSINFPQRKMQTFDYSQLFITKEGYLETLDSWDWLLSKSGLVCSDLTIISRETAT